MAWTFTLIVLLGAGAVDRTAVVLPTYELCEAVREAVLDLPPLDDRKTVLGFCAEGGSDPQDRLLPALSTGGFPS
jgi:hypothetical protein